MGIGAIGLGIAPAVAGWQRGLDQNTAEDQQKRAFELDQQVRQQQLNNAINVAPLQQQAEQLRLDNARNDAANGPLRSQAAQLNVDSAQLGYNQAKDSQTRGEAFRQHIASYGMHGDLDRITQAWNQNGNQGHPDFSAKWDVDPATGRRVVRVFAKKSDGSDADPAGMVVTPQVDAKGNITRDAGQVLADRVGMAIYPEHYAAQVNMQNKLAEKQAESDITEGRETRVHAGNKANDAATPEAIEARATKYADKYRSVVDGLFKAKSGPGGELTFVDPDRGPVIYPPVLALDTVYRKQGIGAPQAAEKAQRDVTAVYNKLQAALAISDQALQQKAIIAAGEYAKSQTALGQSPEGAAMVKEMMRKLVAIQQAGQPAKPAS